MELDSVLVHVRSHEDIRRLTRAGADVWQRYGRVDDGRGRVRYEAALMRIPAAVAIRLQLVNLGGELGEVADVKPKRSRARSAQGASPSVLARDVSGRGRAYARDESAG